MLKSGPVHRNATIDLLRGIAILSVLLLHFHLAYRLTQSPLRDWLPLPLLRALLVNGNYGVTMFFAISGFLITQNSLARWGSLATLNARGFYRNRLARIMPPLLLALAIIVALGLSGWRSFDNIEQGQRFPPDYFLLAAGSVLTFWHNVLMQHAGWFNYAMNIYWSLSVEEVFYLGFPLLCLLLRKERWVVLACLLFIVIGPLYRGMQSDDELFFECGYLACFDAIAMGVIAALAVPHLRAQLRIGPRLRVMVQVSASLVLAGAFYLGIDGHEVAGFSVVALATAVLLVLAADERPAARWHKVWPLRGLCWMGSHSYELYLFHIIALGVLRDVVSQDGLLPGYKLPLLFGFILVSVFVAWIVARYWSEPVNRRLRVKVSSL
jgi:peptidoglycan/LPS O-acetylase OafA/YrhL